MLKNTLSLLTFRQIIAITTLFLAIILPQVTPESFLSYNQLIILIMVVWMVLWWVLEITAIPITSLLPIILLPLTEISPLKSVTANYAHPLIFLFLGGFIIAATMEYWNLHKRIALHIINKIGKNADTIIGGFMISTAILSMWISNTATTVMMLPIGVAIIKIMRESEQLDKKNVEIKKFSTCIMISIAYAANIGGTATLIGTPPNAILAAFIQKQYDIQIGFAEWIMIGFPFAAILLFLGWIILTKFLFSNTLHELPKTQEYIKKELHALGKPSHEEKWIGIIFSLTAIFWMARPYVNEFLEGISVLFRLNDTSIVLLSVLALSIIPSKQNNKNIIYWPEIVKKIPWGILLLFGGGLTIASSIAETSLVETLGQLILSNGKAHWWLTLLITITVMLLLTELMSNMALTAILLPITATIAIGLNQDPLTFLIPVTLAASCAFMMPIATPPNAIVFGSGYIKMKQMIKAGTYMNTISIILITLLIYPLVKIILL